MIRCLVWSRRSGKSLVKHTPCDRRERDYRLLIDANIPAEIARAIADGASL